MNANPLSWSVSRSTVLRYCSKKYFFQYYTYYLRGVDEKLWLESLTLKNLQSFDMWVGEKTHRVISSYLRLVRKGEDTKEAIDAIKEDVRIEMERDFQKSKKKDYTKYDKYNKFGLSEHFYGIDIDDKLGEGIQRVYENLDSFSKNELITEIKEYFIEGNKIYIEPKVPDFERMKFQINVPELMDVVIWGAPDFGIVEKGEKYTIYDWKSGKEERREGEISDQLKVYAQKILSNTEQTIDDIYVETYEVYLPSMNKYGGKINQKEIDEVVERIIKDVEKQRSLLKDQDVLINIPVESAMFIRTTDLKKCETCTFRKVCDKLKEFEGMDLVADSSSD